MLDLHISISGKNWGKKLEQPSTYSWTKVKKCRKYNYANNNYQVSHGLVRKTEPRPSNLREETEYEKLISRVLRELKVQTGDGEVTQKLAETHCHPEGWQDKGKK